MAVFADASFRQAIDDGDLLIRPFSWNSLQPYCYELHLGNDLFRQTNKTINPLTSSPLDHWVESKLEGDEGGKIEGEKGEGNKAEGKVEGGKAEKSAKSLKSITEQIASGTQNS